jgi:signal transduction histidine kinase
VTAAAPTRRAPHARSSDALIRIEQVGMLYRQLGITVTGNLTGAVILSVALLGEQPTWKIATWLGLVCANQFGRVLVYHFGGRGEFVRANIDRAAAYWVASTWVSGVLWGSTAFLFFVSGQTLYQTLLTISVLGIATSSVLMVGSHIPSFYGFIVLALVPYVVRNALEGAGLHLVLSAVLAAITLGTLSFGRNYNRMLVESLRNRFEKETLADKLAAQNLDLENARLAAEQARQQAETANRSKTQFFAAASHDLRQPLHAMGLFAGALQEKVTDPDVLNVVESINASVAALEGLFNELLDISKIDSGIVTPRLADFPVGDVLDTLMNEFSAEARERGLSLAVVGSKRRVHSDAFLLERILRNLMSNAVRYTRTGGVLLGCRWRPDRVRIEIWDTGPGIPEDQQGRIFDEFYQLENPGRTSKKGLGLGLSIVKRLSGLLGYRVDLRSRLGRGTVFGFDVPLARHPATESETALEEKASPRDLADRLVVVIDDEEAIVEGMRLLLNGWGAQVIGSLTGDDVVAAVEQHDRMPDLIIADYRLGGGIVGTDVIERLRRELDPEIPAILVTGSSATERVNEAGEKRYQLLVKPVQPARLRAMMDSALRGAA